MAGRRGRVTMGIPLTAGRPVARTGTPRPSRGLHERLSVLVLVDPTEPDARGADPWWWRLACAAPELRWTVQPLGELRLPDAPPPHVVVEPPLHLARRSRPTAADPSLPAELHRHLHGPEGTADGLAAALARCAERPGLLAASLDDPHGWARLRDAVAADPVGGPAVPQVGGSGLGGGVAAAGPQLAAVVRDVCRAAALAAAPLPPADVVLATSAGWPTVPAAVHPRAVVLRERGPHLRGVHLAAALRAHLARSTAADEAPEAAARRRTAAARARGLARLAHQHATLLLTSTDADDAWLEHLGVPSHRIVRVPDGVPTPPVRPAPRQARVAVTGHPDVSDLATALRAAARLRDQGVAARFLHLGPPPDPADPHGRSLRRLHTELDLAGTFGFVGPVSAATMLPSVDVVLHAALHPAVDLDLLHALAHGRAVVAAALPGRSPLLAGAGLLTPAGDDTAVAGSLRLLLDRPDLADGLGDAGRAAVARGHHDLTAWADHAGWLRAVASGTAAGAVRRPHTVVGPAAPVGPVEAGSAGRPEVVR